MGPLKGIRVLDLSRFQACPLCGMLLADMGAEVIRVESPRGAPDRTWGQLGPDGETLLYKIVGRNKKGITLRVDTPKGMQIFRQLVERSDVVLHNYTPGAPIAKELSYERLKETNDGIIVAMVSGYGQTGPDAENPCFDAVAQARSGGMVLTGFPGDPPVKTTVTYIDVGTGLLATIGVLLALRHREKTGLGQDVDVSLFDTASFATQCLGTLLLYNFYGDIRRQVGNRGFHSYIGVVKARDKWILISPATDGIWKRFTQAIGRKEMATDPNFKTDMDRFRNASLIDPIVEEWAKPRAADDIVALMNEERVPCGIVNTIDESLNDPQVKAREMIKFMDYPGLGEIPLPGIPIKLSSSPGSIRSPAPQLGEHNNEVYSEVLGFKPEDFSRLKQEGII